MTEKLKVLETKYEEISDRLALPEVVADMELYKKLMKEYKELDPIIGKYREYLRACESEKEATEILAEDPDEEMRLLADEELEEARSDKQSALEELKILLLPKDPDDDKNVVIEIRGGAGGEEAALFSSVLYRMYNMYADRMGWKTEIVNMNETELGGFKEVSFMIDGEGAYSRLKYESGVHRVQRVPETESQGRIHTSTVTVAVLPEVEDVTVEIDPGDLEIDTHRASGAGGQHINKTDSAIRILHKPTGIVVDCQDERSQLKNKEKAMKVLRSKLYELELSKQTELVASKRRSQVGTGDRSERIRTYNYPQSRVTDHRIGLTSHNIEGILNGNLDEIIDALATYDRTQMLQNTED